MKILSNKEYHHLMDKLNTLTSGAITAVRE